MDYFSWNTWHWQAPFFLLKTFAKLGLLFFLLPSWFISSQLILTELISAYLNTGRQTYCCERRNVRWNRVFSQEGYAEPMRGNLFLYMGYSFQGPKNHSPAVTQSQCVLMGPSTAVSLEAVPKKSWLSCAWYHQGFVFFAKRAMRNLCVRISSPIWATAPTAKTRNLQNTKKLRKPALAAKTARDYA